MNTIKAVIWDLDHTLYQHDLEFVKELDWALARAVVANGADIDLQSAFNLSARSFEETGASHTLFLEQFPELSAPKLHDDFHHEMDERLINPFKELPDLFTAQPDIEHFIVTHSARHWAERVVDFIGLADYIPNDHIIDFRELGYNAKHENYAVIDELITRAGLESENMVMVEDTIKNLKPAHDRGLVTIYVHNNEELPEIPDYVDYIAQDANEAMRIIDWLNNTAPEQHPLQKRKFNP